MKSWVAYQKKCHHIQLHKCEKFKKLLSTKTKCTFQTQRPRMPKNCSNWRWIHHQYIPSESQKLEESNKFWFKIHKKIGTKEGSFKAALTENIFRFFCWNLLKQKNFKNIDILFDFQKKKYKKLWSCFYNFKSSLLKMTLLIQSLGRMILRIVCIK